MLVQNGILKGKNVHKIWDKKLQYPYFEFKNKEVCLRATNSIDMLLKLNKYNEDRRIKCSN